MSIDDQSFQQCVTSALFEDRKFHAAQYCVSRLISAVSYLLIAKTETEALLRAAEIAALAQRAAVEGDPVLKHRPASPTPSSWAGKKRGGIS